MNPSEIKTIDELCFYFLSEKDKWLRESISKHVPPVFVRWADEKKNIPFLVGYLKRKKIQVIEHPDGRIDLEKEGKVVSEFPFKIGFIWKD